MNLKSISSLQWIFLLLITLNALTSKAQMQEGLGARSTAMGQATTTISDAFSIYNNPGTLGFIEYNSLGAGLRTYFGVPGLFHSYFTGSKKLGAASAAIGIRRLGDDIYSKSNISLAFSHGLGLAALGGTIHYTQIMAEGFESKGYWTTDLGGIARLGNEIKVSGLIRNIFQALTSSNNLVYIPTVFVTGVAYHPDASPLILRAQYDHNLSTQGNLGMGVEYDLQSLTLILGIRTHPSVVSYGFSMKLGKLELSYAGITHQNLGISHELSLSLSSKDRTESED